jgi:hypothetical protein
MAPLAYLRTEMGREGLPAVMMIVGGDGVAVVSMRGTCVAQSIRVQP